MSKHLFLSAVLLLALSSAASADISFIACPDPLNPSTPWQMTVGSEYWIPIRVTRTAGETFSEGFNLYMTIGAGDSTAPVNPSNWQPSFVETAVAYSGTDPAGPINFGADPRTSGNFEIPLTVPAGTLPVLAGKLDPEVFADSEYQVMTGTAYVSSGTATADGVLGYMKINAGNVPGTYALQFNGTDYNFVQDSSGPITPALVSGNMVVSAVPEPATYAQLAGLFGVCSVGYIFSRRRAKKAKQQAAAEQAAPPSA
jgi:hypothetical protein